MTVQLSDLPQGWAKKLDQSQGQTQCKADRSDLTRTAATNVPGLQEFDESDVHAVLAGAQTWGSETDAATAYSRGTSMNIIRCAGTGIEKSIRADADSDLEVGHASISEVSFRSIGDESIVFRIRLPLSTASEQADIYIDYVVFRVGRGTAQIVGFNLSEPFEQPLLGHLASVTARRGSAAQAADAA